MIKKLFTLFTLLTLSIGVGWAETWVKTAATELSTGDVVVVVATVSVYNNYALKDNGGGASSPPTAVGVTLSNDGSTITSNVPTSLQWNLSVGTTDGGDRSYKFGRSETNFLYCTATNNGVRVGTNSNNVFIIDNGYLKNVATSRFVGVYNEEDWRCYTSINNNIKDQTFTFYKLESSSAVATPVISLATGTYLGSQTVTISCNTEGAKIYYSFNNTDYTEYESSITISTSTTLYAKAILNEIESDVASETYTLLTDVTPAKPSTATFVASEDTGESSIVKDGVTFTSIKGENSGASDPILNNGSEYRLYKYSTTTFSVDDGCYITKIEFTGNNSNYPVSGFGETLGLIINGNDGTWYGHAQTVSFVAQVAQVQCTQIKVYYTAAAENGYYLFGEFNGWATGDSNYKFTKQGDGSYVFVYSNYTANKKFKFAKYENGTATLIGVSNGGDNYGLHKTHHTNIAMDGADTYSINDSGEMIFTIHADGTAYDVDKQLYMKGTYNEWANEAMTLTADGWTITKQLAANAELGFQDSWENGIWHGCGSSSENLTVNQDKLDTDLALWTDGRNFYFPTAGNYSFTVSRDLANVVISKVPESHPITTSVVTDPADKVGGTISADKETALEGETVTLTITTYAGYDLESVKLNGNAITATNGVYIFEMPDQDANVIAYFTALPLNITVNNDEDKGIVIGIPETSTVGSPITFTVSPHGGYTVSSVTYTFTPTGGASNTKQVQMVDGAYTFNMPAYDVTVAVEYDEIHLDDNNITLFHETFGNNTTTKAREWDNSYSVKSGVAAVYSGITGYTVLNAKQSKDGQGNPGSALFENGEGTIIMGPLNVADYENLQLSYQWKAGSTSGTYSTKAYYATSKDGAYTELSGTGNGATTYVLRTYNMPAAAEVDGLYLKIVFSTSNAEAHIDEVDLSGKPKTTLAIIEAIGTVGDTYTVADDLQVVYVATDKNDNNKEYAFARDMRTNSSIDAVSCSSNATDFMVDVVSNVNDHQNGPWQQNNWVRLDISGIQNQFDNFRPVQNDGKHVIIKGGSLTGQYIDKVNYTIKVNSIADQGFDIPENKNNNYVPNVYSPANFYVVVDENTTPPTYTPTYIQAINNVNYWFMTPKVMEVCKITWAMWYDGTYTYPGADGELGSDDDVPVTYPAGFYMQDGEVPLKGGISADLTSYNTNTSGTTPNPRNGASYRFLTVITKTQSGKKEPDTNPDHHYPQDGSTLNTSFKVAALNLDTSDGSDQIITAVSEVKTGNDVVSVTYCDLAGRMSLKPFAGVNIIVTRYSDGTVKTTKAIK